MKALIIGSGFGGLATALRLTHHGYEVEIVEKYHQPGGRVNQLTKDGFSFDIGSNIAESAPLTLGSNHKE